MIEHTVLLKDVGLTTTGSDPNDFRTALNTISSAYIWNSKNVNIGNNLESTYGDYYFTDTSHIKIDYFATTQIYLGINLITPNGTKRIDFTEGGYCTISIGKTNKGICICAYSGPHGSRNSYFYNLYIGEITTLDGITTKGCIYAADNGTLTIATDDGISSEKAQTSTINADRTAILAPVVDTTYGNVFKDIYFMRSSPLDYNIMAVEGQGNFLCGKTLCLKDQEVGA